MKLYMLYGTGGEYSDSFQIECGMFSSEELAVQAKQKILEEADREIWPWSRLEDNYGKLELNIITFILDEISLPLCIVK